MFKVNTPSNYTAKIFKIDKIRKHPNADKLQLVSVDYQNVITGMDAKVGDIYVYFPLECTINKDYLSWSNSFSHSELNQNKSAKGFFGDQGRVRAVKLRGTLSEGYIVPLSNIVEWLRFVGHNADASLCAEGTEFDTYSSCINRSSINTLVCEKYVPKRQHANNNPRPKKERAEKTHTRIVENQFRLHCDTAQLKRAIHNNVNPNDIITISNKMHGANCVLSKVLCKRNLRWYERWLKKFGVKINEVEYVPVCSSRKVIKKYNMNTDHYYKKDIWTDTLHELSASILPGVSLYGELVGYTSNGGFIQKGYDYGCSVGQKDFFVFRITYTNVHGHVIEFTTKQVERYCNKYGLKTVPVHYYGYANKYVSNYKLTDEEWREQLLETLTKEFLEKKCDMCKNDVHGEGIVLSVEGEYFQAFKLKSLAFLNRETEQLDTGETKLDEDENA